MIMKKSYVYSRKHVCRTNELSNGDSGLRCFKGGKKVNLVMVWLFQNRVVVVILL